MHNWVQIAIAHNSGRFLFTKWMPSSKIQALLITLIQKYSDVFQWGGR